MIKSKKMHFAPLSMLTCIMIALLLTACGGKSSGDHTGDELQGDIRIDGSSTVYPITEAVAEEYRNVAPKVKISVALSGTGGGFKKFGRAEIDINDASRAIKEKEIELAESNGVKYVELTVGYDGMAVVVNPQNDWCNDMTVEELKLLWSPEAQGKIMKWNQIRPEWPDEEVHLFGPGVESGTYDYFTEAIVGKSHSSRGDFTASEDDNVLVQGVASDKNSLGFFGLAYYEENADKLKVIGIDDGNDENGAGPIKPSLESVKNKTYAPLGRPLFIYVNSEAGKRAEVQSFVSFYLENMNVLSTEVGFIPLDDTETQNAKSVWTRFVEGITAGD